MPPQTRRHSPEAVLGGTHPPTRGRGQGRVAHNYRIHSFVASNIRRRFPLPAARSLEQQSRRHLYFHPHICLHYGEFQGSPKTIPAGRSAAPSTLRATSATSTRGKIRRTTGRTGHGHLRWRPHPSGATRSYRIRRSAREDCAPRWRSFLIDVERRRRRRELRRRRHLERARRRGRKLSRRQRHLIRL